MMEEALRARGANVEKLMKGGSVEGDAPFVRLGEALHVNPARPSRHPMRKVTDELDARCRSEGFHLLQAWDFQQQRFSDESAAELLVRHCSGLTRRADTRTSIAILLDVFWYAQLSLLAMRAWDDDNAEANLDRVTRLIQVTRGQGSGLAYVDDAETLLFLAASYFHPDETSYDTLLARVRALPMRRRRRIAETSGAMLSAHLRWGFRFMYGRDIQRMRDDNKSDYPWVRFAVETLADGGDAEALLVAVAADPWEMLKLVPKERRAFEALQPSHREFSPLSVTFNFPSNAAVALVAVTIEDGRFYPSLNALFTRASGEAGAELAERLTKYSASDPSRLGAGGAPLVVHDPTEGARAWNAVQRETG